MCMYLYMYIYNISLVYFMFFILYKFKVDYCEVECVDIEFRFVGFEFWIYECAYIVIFELSDGIVLSVY